VKLYAGSQEVELAIRLLLDDITLNTSARMRLHRAVRTPVRNASRAKSSRRA